MSFERKYLKYKAKYMHLKSLIGGVWKCSNPRCGYEYNQDDKDNCFCGTPKKRNAAEVGQDKRRKQEKKNEKLDKQLEEDMGTSKGYYDKTKEGTERKEYHGK
jgi:hypothetical protein